MRKAEEQNSHANTLKFFCNNTAVETVKSRIYGQYFW